MNLTSLLIAAALGAGEPAEPELRVVDVPFAPGEVPAGSRDDQLLWTRARDGVAEALNQFQLANQALYAAGYARANLDELEKAGPPDAAERARALRARVEPAAKALEEAMPRTPIGRCRYTLLYFEQSMGAPEGSEPAARLAEMRGETRRCADDTEALVRVLAPAVERTRTALDEVGPELRERVAALRAASGAASGAAPTRAPAAQPSGAPAEKR